MKKLAIIAAVFVATTTLSMAAIGGSAHDFSGTAWTNEICAPCHVPHNATGTYGYLWDHTETTANHTVYFRTGMNNPDTNVADPGTGADGTSVLCLSCHDGTVAVDAFGTNTPVPTNIDSFSGGGPVGYADLGIDLSNDHPINVDLGVAQAADNAGYKTVAIAEGLGIVTETGKVTCASCHDVHNNVPLGAENLLRINNTGSALCLACHTK